MRICYVCADSGVELSKFNGSATHVRGLVGAFAELGHRVDLLMSRTAGTEELGVRVRPIPRAEFAHALNKFARGVEPDPGDPKGTTKMLRALRRIWTNAALERTLREELTEHRPDLVYERHSPFCVAGPVVAHELRVPHVLEVNAPLAWEGAQHRDQALGEAVDLLESVAFRASRCLVAVSEELRDYLVDRGVRPHKIHVVPNAVDAGRFCAEGRVLPAGLESKIVIGFVGSLKGWHGIEVLAEAFAELASDPRMHLLVVGNGPLADVLGDLRDRCPGQVTLTGAVHPSAVPCYLRAMDVAVAPYPPHERFYFSPIKLLEYMASATAVVASRIGQIERLIRDGATGLLVEPGNPGALAAAVRRIAGDARLRQDLGRRAAEDVRRRHGWRQRAVEILESAEVPA